MPTNRPAFGLYIMLPSPEVVALVLTLAPAGLDFVVLDAQHRPFNPETIAQLARASAAAGMACLVRVPAHAHAFAEAVLDFGASGIVFPVVDTVQQAEAAVAACRYPPRGNRGIGGIPSLGLGAGRDPLCVIQVERAPAVEVADQILGVPGIDAVMPGPADIAASMGVMTDYASIADAVAVSADLVRRVERSAESCGVGWFRYCATPDAIGEAVHDGCRLVLIGNDADLLLGAGRELLGRAHAFCDGGPGGSL
jgi:2-dehydro-3-deoxyglucarate aldolase/4-hydroxy-2-oxoheptanedioate aldolase